MNSKALPPFWQYYSQLPTDIRRRATKAYQIWRTHPQSPGLQFKRVGNRQPIYSVRITSAYRALGLLEGKPSTGFGLVHTTNTSGLSIRHNP